MIHQDKLLSSFRNELEIQYLDLIILVLRVLFVLLVELQKKMKIQEFNSHALHTNSFCNL